MNLDRSFTRRAAVVCLVLMLISGSGCSLPKIIILNDPLSAEEHIKLGRIYETEGKSDLAMQQYETAAKQDAKSVTAYLLIGDLSYRNGMYDAAESAYEKAVKLQPGNGDIYNNLCWVYLKQNRKIDKAEQLIKKAMAATPEHKGYYLDTMGVILLKLERPAESITALRQALDLVPGDQSEYVAEIYTHLVEAYRKSGDEVRARAAEEEANLRRKH